MRLVTVNVFRGVPELCHTSKMDYFVKIVNDWKLLNIFAKHYVLDISRVLNTSLSDAYRDPNQTSLIEIFLKIVNTLTMHKKASSQTFVCVLNTPQEFLIQSQYCYYRETSETVSTPSEVFCEKAVLKKFAKFTEKHLWWKVF